MSHRVLNKTNLKASEIRDALVAGGGVVDNNTLSFFKRSANVNIWSKYKPVTAIGGPQFVQDFDSNDKEYYLYQWWKSANGNCGINTANTVTSGIDNFIQNIKNGNYLWTYELPSYPYRLGDFRNYDIDAHCPVSGQFDDEYWLQGQDPTGRLTFTLDCEIDLPDTNLTFDDILIPTQNEGNKKLSDFYMGIVLWNKGNTKKFYPTDTKKIGTGSASFEIEGFNAPAFYGEWTIIPYVSSVIQNGITEDEQAATYATLNIPPKQIYIHAPGSLIYTIALAGYIVDEYGNAQIQYSIDVENNDSSPKDGLSIELWVVRTPKKGNPAGGNEVGGGTKQFTTDTIGANSKVTYFSTNYDGDEIGLKEAPAFTVRSEMFDIDGYDYWICSRSKGYVTTYNQLEEINPK